MSILPFSTMYLKVLRSLINSSGTRPQALGNNYATNAVPKTQLSDGSARGLGWSREQSVRGLIPRTSLE
jgi:hypothetical protein